MKHNYIYFIILYVAFVNGQEQEKPTKSSFKTSNNLYNSKLIYSTKISEKWELKSELAISNAFDYTSIEFLPISIEYHITKKWKVFGGPKLRYSFVKNDTYLGTQDSFKVLGQIGTRYDISKDLYGEFLFEYPLSKKANVQKNYKETLFKQSPFRFTVGHKF